MKKLYGIVSKALSKPNALVFPYRIPKVQIVLFVESVKVELRRSIGSVGVAGSCHMHSSKNKTIGLYQFHIKKKVYLHFKYKVSKLCT